MGYSVWGWHGHWCRPKWDTCARDKERPCRKAAHKIQRTVPCATHTNYVLLGDAVNRISDNIDIDDVIPFGIPNDGYFDELEEMLG